MLVFLWILTIFSGLTALSVTFSIAANPSTIGFVFIGILWAIFLGNVIGIIVTKNRRKHERASNDYGEQSSEAKKQGDKGERVVATYFKKRLQDGEALFNNITIPCGSNTNSQIDHIYVSRHGVFVIETKNYSGKIYGSENDDQWVESFNYGRQKFYFYNQVAQNATHVIAVKKLLRDTIDVPIVSLVVFVGGDIDSVDANVYYLENVDDLIDQYKDVCLSHDDIAEIADVLDAYKATTPQMN
jgi:hypothetical protein